MESLETPQNPSNPMHQSPTSSASSPANRLPIELWLHILTFLPSNIAWQSLRDVNRQLRTCVEDYALASLVPHFTVALTYSLGTGTTHRWYEVRATVTMRYTHIHRRNPQYAQFALVSVHPERTRERAVEKWKRMCADGLGPDLGWRVRFAVEDQSAVLTGGAQTWRVMFGIDEPAEFGYVVKMRRLVVGDEDAVWVDWREMLNGYFRRTTEKVQLEDIINI